MAARTLEPWCIDEVERFVRGFEAFAARSGQRIVELRASGRGVDVCVNATFEKVEIPQPAPPAPPARESALLAGLTDMEYAVLKENEARANARHYSAMRELDRADETDRHGPDGRDARRRDGRWPRAAASTTSTYVENLDARDRNLPPAPSASDEDYAAAVHAADDACALASEPEVAQKKAACERAEAKAGEDRTLRKLQVFGFDYRWLEICGAFAGVILFVRLFVLPRIFL